MLIARMIARIYRSILSTADMVMALLMIWGLKRSAAKSVTMIRANVRTVFLNTARIARRRKNDSKGISRTGQGA